MNQVKTKITRDGKKNTVVMVWGEVDGEETLTVLDPSTSPDRPQGFKLDQIQYSCEAGVKVRIGWSGDGLVVPVEARGLLNYYQFDSLQPSEKGESLWVNVKGNGAFHLVLDCTKMGV